MEELTLKNWNKYVQFQEAYLKKLNVLAIVYFCLGKFIYSQNTFRTFSDTKLYDIGINKTYKQQRRKIMFVFSWNNISIPGTWM